MNALKKMDIYTLPNILVIQLKRFINRETGRFSFSDGSEKLSDFVDFPLDCLDMSHFVINPAESKDPDNCKYELFGVSHHMGSLRGGHYVASCRNPVNRKWYYFNDSSISALSASEVADKGAYVLFYKKIGF